MTESSSGWLGFVGRLHPLLVHLPIGFLTFLAVIEVATYWTSFKEVLAARRLLLLLSIIAVTVAAGCGWILSWSGAYAEETLAWHKWLGTALVPAVVVLQVLLRRGALVAYRIFLGLTVILLVVAGHYGATLVRGQGYLFVKFRMPVTESEVVSPVTDGVRDDSAPTVFASVVQPILNEYCIGCHGAEKSKGKLRLDTVGNLLKGGESGPVVHPGLASQSLLIKRLRLPQIEDEHMPPSGKKQPKARDIALLAWWINVGAPMDKTINELKMPEAK